MNEHTDYFMTFFSKWNLVAQNFILAVYTCVLVCILIFQMIWCLPFGQDILSIPLFCPCPLVLICEGKYFLEFYSCRKSYLLLEFKLPSFIQITHTSIFQPFSPLNSRPLCTSIYWTSPLDYLTLIKLNMSSLLPFSPSLILRKSHHLLSGCLNQELGSQG